MEMKKLSILLLVCVLALSLFPAAASAEDRNVELAVTVRDFRADGLLFEGTMTGAEGLVQNTLGPDKKPVYNVDLWRELYGDEVSQSSLDAFFNDVPGTNMTAAKTLTLRPCEDEEYKGYWEIDSSIDENGEESDGYFPIDEELFGNLYTVDGETYDDGHNYHFSAEIHTKFKYVKGGCFWFSGDDDVWVFFNGRLVIDLGGVHGEMEQLTELDEIASELGIAVGDVVDFDMFYMERHTTGSNMRIRTNFDFLNLQASAWAQAELAEADALGVIPECLQGADLTQPITRAEFAAVSVKVYEALSGAKAEPIAVNPFTDTSDEEVLKAFNVGVTNGMSDTTFEPDTLLNRQTAATMLTRVYKKTALDGWTLETDGSYNEQFKGMFTQPEPFADDADISGWAKDSVYFMAANGIINGVGGNKFAPRAVTSA
ncbi:MAG: fibro-slime domain-containing protein, partial [Oscillospiraceae bacterium]|nr:fibro-slime domain-containing protein [Oscillospiraceae bacterium]